MLSNICKVLLRCPTSGVSLTSLRQLHYQRLTASEMKNGLVKLALNSEQKKTCLLNIVPAFGSLQNGKSFADTTLCFQGDPPSIVVRNMTVPSLGERSSAVYVPPPCIGDVTTSLEITEPVYGKITEKRAARMIVIRRRKMKKHKLKKLRKRMKFEWAKVRQRREMRKEKAFQAKLIAQIKEAEKFDAAQYVAEKLGRANETKTPSEFNR